MNLICEGCGESFEHFTPHKKTKKKKYCDRCISRKHTAAVMKKYYERKRAPLLIG